MSPARVNPNGNYELQVIMTCQAGSLIVTNVPLWDADNRAGSVCLGAGEIWQISEPSSQFCCESQTSLKNIKSLKKKIISKRVHLSLPLKSLG